MNDMKTNQHQKPPVLILGGSSNALSVARSLGSRGISVYLSVLNQNCACYTKYAKKLFPIADKKSVSEFWADLMLGPKSAALHGSVLFPCNDDGIEFLANYRKELLQHYILDESNPELHLTLLNKRKTMDLTNALGLPTPRFIPVETEADLGNIDPNLMFPVIVKPQHSHLFQKAFNQKKLFFVHNAEELHMRLRQALDKQLMTIVTEFIPGPDSLLGSYYTYIDAKGNPLFHYTKKVVRRFPKNNGQGTYHITAWDSEIAELGLKFFRGINFRGLGNVEFKRDLRDNKLKIIECNPRFTAAHELLVRCGMDISLAIYNHLTGLPVPHLNSYKQGMTLWFPYRDFMAYKELKSLNEITLGQWLKSLIHTQQVVPHFRWLDPMPTLAPFLLSVKGRILK